MHPYGCIFCYLIIVINIYSNGDIMVESSTNYVKVLNYLKLITIDENQLKVMMKSYVLLVEGSDLYITYFDKCEIHLEGKILRIQYIYA